MKNRGLGDIVANIWIFGTALLFYVAAIVSVGLTQATIFCGTGVLMSLVNMLVVVPLLSYAVFGLDAKITALKQKSREKNHGENYHLEMIGDSPPQEIYARVEKNLTNQPQKYLLLSVAIGMVSSTDGPREIIYRDGFINIKATIYVNKIKNSREGVKHSRTRVYLDAAPFTQYVFAFLFSVIFLIFLGTVFANLLYSILFFAVSIGIGRLTYTLRRDKFLKAIKEILQEPLSN